MSRASELLQCKLGPGDSQALMHAETIIRDLESELARKDERIAELAGERDEARKWLINWEWERIGDYWQARGKTKTDLAEMQWPGQGDLLFPEES